MSFDSLAPQQSASSAVLRRVVHAFAGRRVLIIGDLMLDEYLEGQVDRISPEAPVPIVSLKKRYAKPGGAANVALNVRALGGEVRLLGLVGRDEPAVQLQGLLKQGGLPTQGLVVAPERRTTRKVRVMSQSQQLLRIDAEDAHPAQAGEAAELGARFEQLLQTWRPEVIVFEDYDKGALGTQLIEQVLQTAARLGIASLVDPKLRNFWQYRGVSVMKPNLAEVRSALSSFGHALSLDSGGPIEQFQAVDLALREQLAHGASLITLGAGGLYFGSTGDQFRLAALPRRVVDVCGAGDSVAATAALCLASGAAPAELAALANLAGGLACEYVGVHSLSTADLSRGLDKL